MSSTIPPLTSEHLFELNQRMDALEQKVASNENRLSLVVFSNELDKLLAAFTIAAGAAACSMRVSIFLTFWATAALKKPGKQVGGKSFVERAFGWMLPGGFKKSKLSKLDMGGIGRWLIAREMKNKGMPNLEELVELVNEFDVEVNICESSMSLMGIRIEELYPFSNMKICGVAKFLDKAKSSNSTLFI